MAQTQPQEQPQKQPQEQPQERCVMVCQHTSCQRNGSAEVLKQFQNQNIPGVTITASGCMGQCSTGPTVRVTPDEIWYYRVLPPDIPQIVQQHLIEGEPVQNKLHPRIHQRISY
ncbi:(2Fe-2S) ferredoxin domain-containing protein [Ancylothrix sp. C2]|uniref:(2Fe-2S) ferredoxin domain-containing protein n=1 Tax=Ancylothrix sp. D3o TaxID=2953691 RepID=UPI0021BB0362|nr:(2Fe-2S) ferredoxin domain-containing protein [Ancylothrix sp. D3o]MCT7950070.1 (2Fe-2S) ferredoxin domain-containing protein [Ancylothrix sp. D3o]